MVKIHTPPPENPLLKAPVMEKFTSPEPLPTEREREILYMLVEECAEVQKRATKMLRFGVLETQEGQPYSNRDRLSSEYGDLIRTAEDAVSLGILDMDIAVNRGPRRAEKMAKYMQSSEDAPVNPPRQV